MTDRHDIFDQLLERLINGEINHKEFLELEEQMLADPELRRRYRMRMRLESNLYSECQVEPDEILPPIMQEPARTASSRWPIVIGAAAALVLAAIFAYFPKDKETLEIVATIESQDGAEWSGMGLLVNGDGLAAGTMKLERGVASLKFESGTIAALEAPVTIELIDPMRCRLTRGKAVFDVPEPAIGFVVETPNGYAVDHGTRFAVGLQADGEHVEFGVISGRISVHHDKTQITEDLKTGGMLTLTPTGIGDTVIADDSPSIRTNDPSLIRLRTNGKETSIVHGDLRETFLDPGLLMVKKDIIQYDEDRVKRIFWAKDRRSLIAFELNETKAKEVEHAALRLNIVPSGRGYAWLLPEKTNIEVYGIRDSAALESWDVSGLKWEDAPGSLGESTDIDTSEVSLLGSFEIERSFLEGPVVFESPELTRFVNQDSTGIVGFLLVSNSIPQDTWALVHAFASSLHVEAAGPILDVKIK